MSAKIRFIGAGAGSGKTYRLTEILGEELASGRAQPRGVIATTFTRKAAAELRERVRAYLIGQGNAPLAHAMGQAFIGTVNAVCGELLGRFAFEAGISTEQRVLDEASAASFLERAMDAAIDARGLKDLLRIADRLGATDRPFGSDAPEWKSSLSAIVGQARSNGIEADVLRTFAAANADSLLEHFGKPTRDDLDAALGIAMQGAITAIGRANSKRKNTNEYLELLEKSLRLHKEGSLPWSQWAKLCDEGPEVGLAASSDPVQSAAGAFAQHPRLHADIREYLRLIFDLAAETLSTYANLKAEVGGIDFVDQERLLLKVLELQPVRDILAQELDVLMVDEFQDTSPIQLALFTRLAQCAREVVWVGDVKQAIYGFRGSDSALMAAVIESLPESGAAQEILGHSWRSRPALVGFANALFGDRFPGLGREQVCLHPKREEYEGAPALIDWLVEGKNQGIQMAGIAAGVANLVAEGTLVCDKQTKRPRPARHADIAVLARSNAAVLAIAAALTARGVPCSTSQPGLCQKAEVVLALACLRRLVDPGDTLATAEIVSLADCAEPEAWITERLAWLEKGHPKGEWREVPAEGFAAHPIVAELAAVRAQVPLLSPREAVETVIARCGLVARVLQWQQDEGRARLRLANLDRLLELATEYEDQMRSSHGPATLSGFILWLGELGANGDDGLPEPAIDAVRVMTHHGAKGLEWPIVVACDLAKDIRDRLWSVQAESPGGIDVRDPLAGRFVHYWPWPFGAKKKVDVADHIAASPKGVASRKAAEDEDRRLLYVSFTRARDVLVLARLVKKPDGEWTQTVGLADWLAKAKGDGLPVGEGMVVPFRSHKFDEVPLPDLEPANADRDLTWFEAPASLSPKLPLRVSPSSAKGLGASVAETVGIGSAIDTSRVKDRTALGNAVHACLAAHFNAKLGGIGVEEVAKILARAGVSDAVDAAALHGQVVAVAGWVKSKWADAKPLVEMPVQAVTGEGQIVGGRMDSLIEAADGWLLMDYKSGMAIEADEKGKIANFAGQLAAYGEALMQSTGRPLQSAWIVMPVAGKAIRIMSG